MTDEKSFDQMRERLDACHEWPCVYTFKFIVPSGDVLRFLTLIELLPTSERKSKNGKYTSLTIDYQATCAEEVVMVYQKASQVEGVIAM